MGSKTKHALRQSRDARQRSTFQAAASPCACSKSQELAVQRGAVTAVPVAPIISWLSRADVFTWATQSMCICRGDIERRSFICRVFATQWWNAAADGLG